MKTEREVAQILADSSADLTDHQECLDVLWEKGVSWKTLTPGWWVNSRDWALDIRKQTALARQQERALISDSIPLKRATIADSDHRSAIPATAVLAAILAFVVQVLR